MSARGQGGKRRRAKTRASSRQYRLYVVELAPAAIRAHARAEAIRGCVYVGQTAHSPEHRFSQHRRGGRLSASKVRRFGVRLRPDLYEAIEPLSTRDEAARAEAQLAADLERQGFCVFWS